MWNSARQVARRAHAWSDRSLWARTQSIDLTYNEDPYATRLRKVTFAGYIRGEGGAYTRKALPPVELTSSLPTREPKELLFDDASLSDLDLDSIGRTTQWVDLEGDERGREN